MKTIVEPRQNLVDLWGRQAIQEKDVYRMMKYVLWVDYDKDVLLHNVVTGHLVLLTKEEAESLTKLPGIPMEPMHALIRDHFLVPEGYDEYKIVNQLRSIYRKRSTGDAINHFTILTTTFCNAHCFYCYESEFPRVHMTEETAQKVIKFIEENHQGNDVLLSWFGGEPLVGIKRIDQITQGLKEKGIKFTSSMISNGYLFDEEIIERSISLWNLKRIQITLDGTEKVYNEVKAYVNARDNPYQRVLRNIDLLTGKEIQVNIRLNIDFYNKDDIAALIEEIGERYSGNKYIQVYLNLLFSDQGFEPVRHTQDGIIELQRIVDKYVERLKELKLARDNRTFPVLKINQCMADNAHSIEIQPDGSFCRCEHENILDSYGSIDEGIKDPEKPLKWIETQDRSENCPTCSLYPACYVLRYCMNADHPCVDFFRLREQKRCEELLRSIYQKSLEDKKNESIHGS